MKTPGQIAQKLKQAQFRHVKREVRRLMKRSPANCKSNRTLPLDLGPVGVCSLDCQVCDHRFEDRAPGCEVFDQKHTVEEVKNSLREFFTTRKTSEIAVRFPDVAALLWALQEESLEEGDWVLHEVEGSGTFFGVPVWTLEEDDWKTARKALESYQAARIKLQGEHDKLRDTNMRKQGEIDRHLTQIDLVTQSKEKLEADLQGLQSLLTLRDSAESTDPLGTALDAFEDEPYKKHTPWWRSLWPF